MIRPNEAGKPVFPSWVQVYRELVEWAILFSLLKKDFGTDTLIVCDGLLRSKVFAKDLFQRLLRAMKARIDEQWERSRRRIYLARRRKAQQGAVAIPPRDDARRCAADRPTRLTSKSRGTWRERAYVWEEFARGDDRADEDGEINKFVGGKMFLVKFGAP